MNLPPFKAEWLETDGLGGFASGTVSGIRTRRYHGLLLVAKNPPAERVVLINGLEAWIEQPGGGQTFISSQRYAPNAIFPRGFDLLEDFTRDPWPTWKYRLDRETLVQAELFAIRGEPAVALRWTLLEGKAGRLKVRLMMSGRDFHSLHRENGFFHFGYSGQGDAISWQPYPDQPRIVARSNASYLHSPDWYRNFLYLSEEERGLDAIEDLGTPGVLSWELNKEPAVLLLGTDHAAPIQGRDPIVGLVSDLAATETKRRSQFKTKLHRAADDYLVARGSRKTLIAGYPWFGDWGRDTFIAIRGLCLVTGRLEEARSILVQWASAVSEGMVPNRFPDVGEQPEFNSVDASLWYVIAVGEYLELDATVSPEDRARLEQAVLAILQGFAKGTRYGIKLDQDGLLAAGAPGYQLTWMDARVNGREITPRIGKPVEIQALWQNATLIGSRFEPSWLEVHQAGQEAFHAKFWNGNGLFDVVDNWHQPGNNDGAMRPNQIFAVGGLPHQVVTGERAQIIVDAVEALLWTPLGLRSLAPGSPGYVPHYEGGVEQRDGAYHQGTVWPWLAGAFVDAWLRVHGGTEEAKRKAREKFLSPLIAHLEEAGLGHVSEIADAEQPFTPRGCPFQAWSLGELIRVENLLR